MDTMQVDIVPNQEMDDSACIQNDMAYKNGYRQVGLLDLSDDVLLVILKFCTPRDLKALGFTCERLGSLVLERSLWKHVDARSEKFSTARLQWYLDHTLHDETQQLHITGHAKASMGCLGLVNTKRSVAEDDLKAQEPSLDPRNGGAGSSGSTIAEDNISVMRELPSDMRRYHARHVISPSVVCLSRMQGCPVWGDERDLGRVGPHACIGPQFTLTPQILKQLGSQCRNLTTLSLEYCNINCTFINLSQFPRTIKKLSLRGTRFYNLLIDRSFLSNIGEHLPVLEYLDLSECEWMEPSSLLPLSKHSSLTHLIVRECHRLTEFVAYASLTTRYGFRNLKVIDMRGSPVGDSEVSALGWLPTLEELWLSASRRPRVARHAHHTDDECVAHVQLDGWEQAEPEYFQVKSNPDPIDVCDVEEDTSTSHAATAPMEPSTSQDGNEELRLVRRNYINMARHRLYARHPDRDDDSSVSSPPKKMKFNKQDADETQETPQNEENVPHMPAHIQMPSNVIVVSGIRNARPGYRLRQNEAYCLCPEHRSVETTDKATETDNMDLYRQCTCQHAASNSRSKGAESAGRAQDSEMKDPETKDVETDDPENDKSKDSNNETRNSDCSSDEDTSSPSKCEKYVHFRRNRNPEFVNCSPEARAQMLRCIQVLPGPSNPLQGNASNQENPASAGPTKKGTYLQFIRALSDYWKTRVCPNSTRDNNDNDHDDFNNNGNYNMANESRNDNQNDNENEPTDTAEDASRVIESELGSSTSKGDRNKENSATNKSIVGNLDPDEAKPSTSKVGNPDLDDTKPSTSNVGNLDPEDAKQPSKEIPSSSKPNPSQSNRRKPQDQAEIRDSESVSVKRPRLPKNSDNNRTRQDLPEPAKSSPNKEGTQKQPDKQANHQDQIPPESSTNQDQTPPEPSANRDQAPPQPKSNQQQNFGNALLQVHNVGQNLPRRINEVPIPPPPAVAPNRDARRDVQYIVEPRHHVLYVSVGSQLNTYRFPRDTYETDRNYFESHIDSSALVTDFAIRRFGRDDGEDVNYVVNFGPNGPVMMGNSANSRPDRSNLRVLSVTGYRNVTDRSLVHLVNAAPHLRYIDFSDTNVSEQGVERFKVLRPDCVVVFSKFGEKKGE